MPVSPEIRAILADPCPSAAIAHALDILLAKDRHLFEIDANERSFTHSFGRYLQDALCDWHVDHEYNRNGLDPK